MHYFFATAVTADLSETANQTANYVGKLTDILINKAHVLVTALIILIIGWYIVNVMCGIIKKSLEKSHVDASAAGFINSVAKVLLRTLLAIIVVTKLGVDATSIIALITSASLAVGLALQGSLANFAGGVLILMLKPFKVGDYINDGCGHEGTVTSIEIIYTRMVTADNQAICIPNGVLANSSITNVGHEATRRIDFEVSVKGSEDIDHVRAVLLDVAKASEFVNTATPSEVFVSGFDSGAVKVTLRIWCTSNYFWNAKFDVQEGIKKAFDQNGIVMPFAHMEVDVTNK